ncbi:hypothetical protein [Auritidibacter ignavus]|uniref:hypothetical protein n=1 Tax=Auritidibacter ignavus TaxID=678932 RepID=UPI00244C06C8|nr:hypothetical protein [Auritidibacter ignavus]WGH85201.1 hypothetical protein QDX24_06275 [Auritidibacter ignavus]WGH87489.1 hypothetical protein QDX22_06270 [Auritidibacter ignavus]
MCRNFHHRKASTSIQLSTRHFPETPVYTLDCEEPVNQAFCDALADYQQLAWELDYTDPSATDEYADAMERLADTRDDAEAEKVYRDFVGHLRDPLGDHDTQLFVASEALTEQVLADTGKCHSEGSAQ